MVVSLPTLGSAAGYVEAVVDTGAEITTLMPQGVRALNLRHTDVQALSGPVMNMVGVGGAATFKLTPAQVYLIDSSGQGVTSPFAVEIALAASPPPPDDGASAPLALLGRDILNRCDHSFSFRNGTVAIDSPE
ncbi:MAG: hypothetical protein OXL97_06355 [Chloroflexota bacterium]|nr:hypothetical protein [Chloroflexota bacterium]MDE2884880.1 hypothetical protein [Chloroflexota bacterium]